MEDKLISKLIKKEIETRGENQLPPSIELKLNKAYESIKSDNINIKNEKKNNKKKYAMAASLAIGLMAIVSFNPVLAEKIPVLNGMSQYFKNVYWFNDNYISNANKINITQKDKGIEINLEGVVYDESSIKFIYTINSEKGLQWGVQMRNSSLKINGKEYLSNDSTYEWYDRMLSDEAKISKDGDEIEKYAVVTAFDVSDLKLEDTVKITWEPKEMHTYDGDYVSGSWKFNFKVSKEALKSTSKILDLNQVIEKEGYKYIIEKVILTPVETTLVTKYDGKLKEDLGKAYKEMIEDPENKEKKDYYDKLNKIDNEFTIFRYQVSDENGNEIKMITGMEQSGENGGRGRTIYQPVKEIPKKLIFTWFSGGYDEISRIPLHDLKTPFVIRQGGNMTIIVNSIENNNGKIKINATFNGDYIATRVFNRSISIVPQGLKDVGEISKEADDIEKDNLSDYYSKADKDNNTFDFNFEVDPSQEYVVRFTGNYSKLNEFSIDLSK